MNKGTANTSANINANTSANTYSNQPSFYWNGVAGDGSAIEWANFVALEVVPVAVADPNGPLDTSSGITLDSPENATHWSVFGRWAAGDSDLLHQATTRVEALLYAGEASANFGLPIQILATEAASKASPAMLRSFLDLSTGHLRESTAGWLSQDQGTFESETG